MLFNLIKKSFAAVFENPSITFYFILFLIVLNFLAYYITTTTSFNIAVLFLICAILLCFVFLSGWLQVVKDSTQNEKIKEKNYFTIFLEGIGKNIISISLGAVIFSVVLGVLILITSYFAGKIFGTLDFITKDAIPAVQSMSSLNEFLNNLTDNQKYSLFMWQLSFIAVNAFYNFILMFYFPAIMYSEKKNAFLKPFIALKDSVCFLFKNFAKSLSVFLFIYVSYIITGLLKGLCAHSSILTILLLFVYIYFLSGAVMLIFNCYDKNLCNNGTDSVRENKACDCSCEED